MLAAPVHAPPQMHAPPMASPGGAPGGIAGVLKALAARQAMAGARGPGARQAGGPFPLTQRGNPVSPFGHEPAAGPVPNMPPRPMPMGPA